jgi:uncharacterized protein with von Willebrand factor type A (vWA) domain
MRAALQHAERQGGMVIPKFCSVITKPRPLVILCDISGQWNIIAGSCFISFMH